MLASADVPNDSTAPAVTASVRALFYSAAV